MIVEEPFKEWLKQVDAQMMDIAGCTSRDISDWWYYDAYDEGMHPRDAAKEALLKDGFPEEFVNGI